MITKHYQPPDTPDPLRPTKYRPEYCQQIIEFFDVDPYVKHRDENGNETDLPPVAPCIEGFAHSIYVTKPTIYNWAKKHIEFFYCLERVRQYEKLFIKKAGMACIYEPRFCASVYSSVRKNSPNIHRCKTIRNKMKSIQESLVNEDITDARAETLKNLVIGEAQVTELTDIDERIKKLEKKENASNKK